MQVPALLRIFGTALRAWWDDDALRLGASLAYYALFAIAPVLLVALAIAGMAFGADTARGEMVGQLDQLVGREGARAVQSLLEGASQRRAGLVATVLGSITFVVAATGAFLELQAALNTIWRVGWLASRSPSIPLVWSTVNVLVSFVVSTALFAFLYRFLPDVRLRWRDVVTGAFVTAVLFTFGQQLIGLYLGQSSVASSYGAAGSVMVLLLWVYYSSQILLLGAEFTRLYAQRHGMTLAPESYAVRDSDAGTQGA